MPLNDYEDIVCHADENNFVVIMPDGREYRMSATEFGKRVRDLAGYKGGNIRLISCKAGNSVLAQELANFLQVKVMAATENVNVSADGRIFISNDKHKAMMYFMGENVETTGKWLIFEPQKRGEVKC